MGREEMRAGDADRKAVADQLKAALDEGRLDLSEYDERLQKTYAAKTFADLNGLLDDLPGTVPVDRSQVQPAASSAPASAPAPAEQPPHTNWLPRYLGPYGGVFVVCVLIWLVTSVSAGHLVYFWPVWMAIPLVLGFFGFWGNQGARDARRAARRDRRDR
jgi:Domain of unknown function (DUF1707)